MSKNILFVLIFTLVMSCKMPKKIIGVWQVIGTRTEDGSVSNGNIKWVEFLENGELKAGDIGNEKVFNSGSWLYDKNDYSITTKERENKTKFYISLLDNDIIELKTIKETIYIVKIKDKFSKNTSTNISDYYKPKID